MQVVVDVAITRGPVLGPAGYRRVTTLNGGPADLSVKGSTATYLWCKRAALTEGVSYVTRLRIDDDEVPDFKLVCDRKTWPSKDEPIVEILADLDDKPKDDEIRLHKDAAIRCYTRHDDLAKIRSSQEKEKPVATDVSPSEISVVLRELKHPGTALGETLASFLEKALQAARNDPAGPLGVRAHRFARAVLDVVAVRLVDPAFKVDVHLCKCLKIALVAGGAVAAERIASSTASMLADATTAATAATANGAYFEPPKLVASHSSPALGLPSSSSSSQEVVVQHRSRFFGRLSGGLSGRRGGPQPPAPESSPTIPRRPKGKRVGVAAMTSSAAAAASVVSAAKDHDDDDEEDDAFDDEEDDDEDDDDEFAPPPPGRAEKLLEGIFQYAAAVATTATTSKETTTAASAKKKQAVGSNHSNHGASMRRWPMDPRSDSDRDEADAAIQQQQQQQQVLDDREYARFGNYILRHEQTGGFFCGDHALALRRARERTGDVGPLKVDDAPGTGLLLDYFAKAGGLDAVLARCSPSSKLPLEAAELQELLDALVTPFARARSSTSPALARALARALQRAANARVRDLSKTPGDDLEAPRHALAKVLATLIPDAFVLLDAATQQRRGPRGRRGVPAQQEEDDDFLNDGRSSSSALSDRADPPPPHDLPLPPGPPPPPPLQRQKSAGRSGSTGPKATWKQHVASYWGSSAPLPSSPTQSQQQKGYRVDTACRWARGSAERLDLEVAASRLFLQKKDDNRRLEGVKGIADIADAVLWGKHRGDDRPPAVPPPWVVREDVARRKVTGAPPWQLSDTRLAAWLSRKDVPAATVSLAVRKREALEVGLPALCLAAQCGPFSPTLVDALASLAVNDAQTTGEGPAAKAWVALAARLPLDLVARQREAFAPFAAAPPTTPTVRLVADFAAVAAPRLLRGTQPDDTKPSSLAHAQHQRSLDGGLDVLWRWTVVEKTQQRKGTPATTPKKKKSGNHLAAFALASILRRPSSSSLDRPSLLCAELCVDKLEGGGVDTAQTQTSSDDQASCDRVCRVLGALCVASSSRKQIRDKGEATYVLARRRALERKRGPLGRVALRRAVRDARFGRSPRCALRLCLALAADFAAQRRQGSFNRHQQYPGEDLDEDHDHLMHQGSGVYYLARLGHDDVGLLTRDDRACLRWQDDDDAAAFFAVAAERRALEPHAARRALLDLDASRRVSPDDARAAIALFDVAVFDDLPSDHPPEEEEPSRILASLVDALVRLSIRCPCPASFLLQGKSAPALVARACASPSWYHPKKSSRVLAPRAIARRVADGCLRAVQKDPKDDVAQRAAALLDGFYDQVKQQAPRGLWDGSRGVPRRSDHQDDPDVVYTDGVALYSGQGGAPPSNNNNNLEEDGDRNDLAKWVGALLSGDAVRFEEDAMVEDVVDVRLASDLSQTAEPTSRVVVDAVALARIRSKLRLALALSRPDADVTYAAAHLARPRSRFRDDLVDLVGLLARAKTIDVVAVVGGESNDDGLDSTLKLCLAVLHAALRADEHLVASDDDEDDDSFGAQLFADRRKLVSLVRTLVDNVANDEDPDLSFGALRLIIALARLEASRGPDDDEEDDAGRSSNEVVAAVSTRRNDFARALRRALLPSPDQRGSARTRGNRRRLRGEAYGLARETSGNKRGQAGALAILVGSLLEPLQCDKPTTVYDKDAYARCCELVAALLDEARVAKQAQHSAVARGSRQRSKLKPADDPLAFVDAGALARVAERLAVDVVERRKLPETRAEDEAPCETEPLEDDDELCAFYGEEEKWATTKAAAFYASDPFNSDDEADEEPPEKPHRKSPRGGTSTLERARFALLSAVVRCGGRPGVVVAAARHLAARCALFGATNELPDLAPLDDSTRHAAATRSVALDALGALCESSTEALAQVCDAMAELHRRAIDADDDDVYDTALVTTKLEAADVVRTAPSFHRLQQQAQQQQQQPQQQQPQMDPTMAQRQAIPQPTMMRQKTDHAGTMGPLASRFTSVVVPAERPRHGLAGLDNLGCTCYLNSTLQLLASASAFKSAIYALETNIGLQPQIVPTALPSGPAASEPADDGAEDVDKQLLARELQLLIARLALRDAASISPRAFCDAFKWDGEPIDVRQQQDASEFISNLFQQLEGLSVRDRKSAPPLQEDDEGETTTGKGKTAATAAAQLEHAFGGVFAHELSAVSDPVAHTSRKEEPFYMISVDVKGSRLEDALDAYIAPDFVDYAWRDGGRSERTSKRVFVKKGPRHLLIHLKRFAFDLETLTQRKINTRLEFPAVLDLAPYMMAAPEDLDPDGRCIYHLGGVVVHAGTAHSGHYYSFIKEEGSGEWFEFNDAYVAHFDADAELSAETFGGTEPPPQRAQQPGAPPAQDPRFVRERTRNAFLLAYHRATATSEEEVVFHQPPATTTTFVEQENVALRKARAIFDESNLAFAASLVERGLSLRGAPSQPGGEGEVAIQAAASLGCALCVRTLTRARDDDASALLAKCAAAVGGALSRGVADAAAKELVYFSPLPPERMRSPPEQRRSILIGQAATLVDALRRMAVHPEEAARDAVSVLLAQALRALVVTARRTASSWARKPRPDQVIAEYAARTLVTIAASDDRDIGYLVASAAKKSFLAIHQAPPRNNDIFYERGPSRTAADVLAIFVSSDKEDAEKCNAADFIRQLKVDMDVPVPQGSSAKRRSHVVSTAGAIVRAATCGGPPSGKKGIRIRTTKRRLAAFGTRVELLAGLIPWKETAFDDDDRAVAAAAVGCVALMDRGIYSKRVGDEGRRRSFAARTVLTALVRDDQRKSSIVVSAIAAVMDRCLLGLSRVRRLRRSKRGVVVGVPVDPNNIDPNVAVVDPDTVPRRRRYYHSEDDEEDADLDDAAHQLDDADDDDEYDEDDVDDDELLEIFDLGDETQTQERRRRMDSQVPNNGGYPQDEDEDVDEDHHPHHQEKFTYGSSFLRYAWRALACVLSVDDNLRSWRIGFGLSRALAATELAASQGGTAKLRIAIEGLLSLCKRDAGAREWMRTHPAQWLLDATPDAEEPMGFVATSLDTLRAPLGAVASGVRSWTERRRSRSPDHGDRRNDDLPRRVRLLFQIAPKTPGRKPETLAEYDSDDDPRTIVGKRIKVRWAGTSSLC